MNPSPIIRIYEAEGLRVTVPFSDEAYVNATIVARSFGKILQDWIKIEGNQAYLKAVNDISKNERKQLFIVKLGGLPLHQGTWFHPKLAMAFARWLDVRFAEWCGKQIKDLALQKALEGDRKGPLTRREAMTGLIQQMTGDPGRPSPRKSAPRSRPVWVPIMERVLLDITLGQFNFPHKFITLENETCLLIRCNDVLEHSSLGGFKVTLHSRSLRQQLVKAGVVLQNRHDPMIENKRHFHFMALGLAALARYGLYLPGKTPIPS